MPKFMAAESSAMRTCSTRGHRLLRRRVQMHVIMGRRGLGEAHK